MDVFRRKLFFYTVLVFCFLSSTFGVLRPRGVPLSKKIFYDPAQKFNCLDGSRSIPFHFVNDDFCDCDDGSDEPGTAACPDGEFICCNYGHLPVTLPSSRVNDGICDCCDASDEFGSSADCLDTCKALGLQSLNAAKEIYDKYRKGNETRQVHILEGVEKKEEYRKQLNKLHEAESDLLRLKLQKQDLKEKAEEKERVYLGIQKQMREEQKKRRVMELKSLQEQKVQDEVDSRKAFETLDLNKDEKLTLQEVRSYAKFDYDGDGKVSDMEAQFYMHKREELSLEDFLAHAWRVMKPAFVVDEPNPEDDVSRDSGDSNNVRNSVSSSRVPKTNEADRNAVFEEAGIRRKEFADANKKLQDVQVDIWNIEKKLTADYGPEGEFLALENKCYEFTEKRYVYRVCLFDKVVQLSRHNSDEVLLGLWDKWCGPEKHLYTQMCYTRGSTCWNGPMRSVIVSLQCGLESKMLSVLETSPCVYMFVVETPASCKDVPSHIEKVIKSNVITI